MAESYLDRPQDDGTHKAHPAYNRGKINGVRTVLSIIKNIVSGVDYGQGVNKSPQVEAVRRSVLELKKLVESEAKGTSKSSENAQQALSQAVKLVTDMKL